MEVDAPILSARDANASVRMRMEELLTADADGHSPEALTLRAGFRGEQAEFTIVDGKVLLKVQDADGRQVEARMPWCAAQALGSALLAAGDALERLG